MDKQTTAPRLETNEAQIIERPDGFYWRDNDTDDTFGPFTTRANAIADMQFNADSDIEPGETLQEAEAQIGIADWIDQDTGAPAEQWVPRLEDH
jgi:hypothetical protein